MRKPRGWYLPWLLALLLSACTPIVRPEQANQTGVIVFKPGEHIGQTLVANFAGLNGIEVYLAPQGEAHGQVTLHLKADPESDSDLGAASLPAESITAPAFYRFPLPVQPRSRQAYYAFSLTFSGEGALRVGQAPGSAYLDGSAYLESSPAPDAQLAFRLDYDPPRLAWGLAGEALTWGWYGLLAAFLFLTPGLAVLKWYTASQPTPPEGMAMRSAARIALAAGISLALYPLLFLWTHQFGLHLGRGYALLPGALALLYLARGWHPRSGKAHLRSISLADLTLLALLGLLVLSRFWSIRTLEGPMWGDGMQHTMVVQLLLDHGGLFDSWLPYADIPTFTYHFGFHAATAVFAWLSGLEARFATLWVGQILNILAVLALYPLAVRISGGNRWAGNGALLVAGLLSPQPMFYLNWGRYTQLAGQVILPAALFLTWDWLDEGAPLRPQALGIGALLWAGLGLTHYRVLLMGLAGLGAYLLLQARAWRAWGKGLLSLGAASGVLFLPWFAHAFAGKLLHIFAAQVQPASAQSGSPAVALSIPGSLSDYLPAWVWLLLLLGLGAALWQRRRWAHAFGLWSVLLIVLAYPQWLGLPGASVISAFTVLLAAYIPAGIALGVLLPNTSGRGAAALSLLLVLGGVWGLRARLGEINPQRHAMLTRPDVRAARWAQQHTPPTARFLIDSFPAYNGTVAVGADGGWWLSTLSSRSISHPPLLYGFEADPYPGFRQDLLELTHILRENGVDAPETLAMLQQWGITHVYIGQQQGHVNSAQPALSPARLLESAHYRAVYHQDRVWVFEVRP